MIWLIEFMKEIFAILPDNLNAEVIAENDEFEVVILEADELWSFVGSKDNDQWLWLVIHSKTSQILAFHVGKRNKASGEVLMNKLSPELKKKPTFIQINFQFTMKSSQPGNVPQLEKNQGRRVTLKDLTIQPDNAAQD